MDADSQTGQLPGDAHGIGKRFAVGHEACAA
jgi:hypothetical protein